MKVGDLIREKEFPGDSCGMIIHIGDLRTTKPYKVLCFCWKGVIAFEKKYIQEMCEVISESR